MLIRYTVMLQTLCSIPPTTQTFKIASAMMFYPVMPVSHVVTSDA